MKAINLFCIYLIIWLSIVLSSCSNYTKPQSAICGVSTTECQNSYIYKEVLPGSCAEDLTKSKEINSSLGLNNSCYQFCIQNIGTNSTYKNSLVMINTSSPDKLGKKYSQTVLSAEDANKYLVRNSKDECPGSPDMDGCYYDISSLINGCSVTQSISTSDKPYSFSPCFVPGQGSTLRINVLPEPWLCYPANKLLIDTHSDDQDITDQTTLNSGSKSVYFRVLPCDISSVENVRQWFTLQTNNTGSGNYEEYKKISQYYYNFYGSGTLNGYTITKVTGIYAHPPSGNTLNDNFIEINKLGSYSDGGPSYPLDDCTPYLTKNFLTISNYDNALDGSLVNKRIMNLFIYSNGTGMDITQYKANTQYGLLSFKDSFLRVWSNRATSEIHLIPNFMPNVSSTPNKTTPTNTNPPDFLIDSDGYAVLLPEDFYNDNVKNVNNGHDKFQEVLKFWYIRYLSYLIKIHNNNTVSCITDLTSDLNSILPVTTNLVKNNYLINLKGFRVYNFNSSCNTKTQILDKDFWWNLQNKGSYLDIQMPGFLLSEYYNQPLSITNRFSAAGLTIPYYQGTQGIYKMHLSISVVFRNNLEAVPNLSSQQDIEGACISVSFHELAHAWNNHLIYGTSGTSSSDHNIFVMGNNSKYCLFKYNDTGLPADQFIRNKTFVLSFSESIQHRLANTFAPNNTK